MGGSANELSVRQRVKYWLQKCRKQWEYMDSGEGTLSGICRRIPTESVVIELQLGGSKGRTLHIYPDPPLTATNNEDETSLLIIDPNHFFNEPGGFLRLLPGQGLVIGRHDNDQTKAFQFSESISDRHLTIILKDEHILIKDLASTYGSYVRIITAADMVKRISQDRLHQLYKLISMYGDAFRPLAPSAALHRLQLAHAVLRQNYLKFDKNQDPAEIDTLRCEAIIQIHALCNAVLIGDLHGRVDNLLTLLTLGGGLDNLETGNATLIFLGDAVHPDDDGDLADMHSSLIIMDLILTLMIRYPGQVIYLRGNHDGFSEEISKGGISQGKAWSRTLTKHRGIEYRDAMEAFYQDLPYILLHPWFVACHAGPPIQQVEPDHFTNLRQHPKLIRQLTWCRMAKNNRPIGYKAKHIKKFREMLDIPSTTHVIVGHNIIDYENTLWINAGEIENHHVLYGAHPKKIGWVTFVNGELVPLEYPVEPLTKLSETLQEGSTGELISLEYPTDPTKVSETLQGEKSA